MDTTLINFLTYLKEKREKTSGEAKYFECIIKGHSGIRSCYYIFEEAANINSAFKVSLAYSTTAAVSAVSRNNKDTVKGTLILYVSLKPRNKTAPSKPHTKYMVKISIPLPESNTDTVRNNVPAAMPTKVLEKRLNAINTTKKGQPAPGKNPQATATTRQAM